MRIGKKTEAVVELKPVKSDSFKRVIGNALRIILLLVLIGVCVYINTSVVHIREINFSSDNVPEELNNRNIVVLSDLDNTNIDYMNKIGKDDPYCIIVTGGLCDESGNYDITASNIGELANKYNVIVNLSANDIENKVDLTKVGLVPMDGGFTSKGFENHMGIVTITHEDTMQSTVRQLAERYYEDFDKYNIDRFVIATCSDSVTFKYCNGCRIDLLVAGGTHGKKVAGNPFCDRQYFINGTTLVVNKGIGDNGLNGFGRLFNSPELLNINFTTKEKSTVFSEAETEITK